MSTSSSDVPRFRSQRTIALLGYLVAEQRVLAREQLAALFWPDEPTDKGKANLRRELHNLAQILPDCWEADRVQVAFVPAHQTTVDLDALQQYTAAGEWQAAAELLRGDFLEGIDLAENPEFETWLLGEREHWRQQAETILTQLIAQQSRLAHYHEALRHARRLLRLTPWNESIHRQVMLMLVWTGQRAAALKQFEQCQMILQQELGVAVAEETFTLYERIKQNATLALHNLPAAATPFIGRKEELSRLAGWLTHDHVRLITITGLGGIGKTRLAQAAARQLLARPESEFTYSARFPDGIFFIALAPLQSSAQIVAAIAQTLEFRFSGRDDTEQQLQIYLANKQLLLILDNFEHLLDGAAKVAALLRSAPRVSILVTSRERLNLYQAQVMTIEGLSYPDTTQPDLENYDAVQLFLQAIRRVRYDFSLTEATANALMRICQLMEGMPLGLELAASWIDSRSLSAIVTELEQGLNLLQTEAVDLPRRHRSIRAAFDITWLALSSAERDLFAQLSVFRGGFTLHAAKEIGRATQPVLASLVGKSLLRDSKADKRYDLHELLRQYGAEKLSRNATVETQIRAAHCRYYCDYLHQQEQAIFGADVAKAIKVIESDLDNVRLAWHEAVRQGQIESLRKALSILMEFYGVGGRVSEGYEAIDFATQRMKTIFADSTLKTPDDDCFWADLLLYCGLQSFLVAKFEQAIACYQACLATLRQPALAQLDTRDREARALRWLGQLMANTEPAQAKKLYEQSLALYREVGDQPNVAGLSNLLGTTLRDLGDVQSGYQLLVESLAAAQRVGDQRTQVYTLELLGTFQLQLGHLAEAEASHRQCLSLCQKMQFESMINSTLSGLGVTLIWNGKFAEGCSYLLKRSHKVFDKGPDKTAFLYNGLSMAYLHQGQYDQAYSHCELSLSAAYRSTIPRYISTTLWTKGLIALVQDDPITAEQSLHESLSVIKDIDLVGCHEFPLVGLAFLASQAGDLSAMRHDLWRALRIAVATQSFLSLLHIFPAVALYLSGQRQQAAFALEIYALISQYGHVANSRWFAEIVGDHLQATQASLPAALIAKALRRGKHRDMWSTARGLLAMLANE